MAGLVGPPPEVRRVIMREVPNHATPHALIERGDVQVSFDIPDRDASELVSTINVFSTPIEKCIHCACLNTSFEPFQDPEVRKAIAHAILYEAIFQSSAYGRGAPMWGGPTEITDTACPRPFRYVTEMKKAREHFEAWGFASVLSGSAILTAWRLSEVQAD